MWAFRRKVEFSFFQLRLRWIEYDCEADEWFMIQSRSLRAALGTTVFVLLGVRLVGCVEANETNSRYIE